MIDAYFIIEQGATLSEEDFIKLNNKRKELVYKFHQLLVDMIYVVSDGHDDFDHQIVAINYDAKTFDFIDLSYPEDKQKIQTSSVLYIPTTVFYNKEKFEFVELNDCTLFQKFNLSPFEENLHNKLHIKSLKKIIFTQKKMITNIQEAFDRQLYMNTETKKISNLRIMINVLLKKSKLSEQDFSESEPVKKEISKYSKPSDDKSLIEKYKFESKILREKVIKYKQLYFDLLGK